MVEGLSRDMRARCPEQLPYADNLAKGLRVNVKKTKMTIINDKAGKFMQRGSFLVQFTAKVESVNLSSASFTSVRCIGDVGVLEAN